MKAGKLWFVICAWFLFICESCLSRYVLENNCLKVSSPENLRDTHACVIDSCGVPQHGGSLTGVVAYPKANRYACNTFTHEFSFKTGIPGRLPVVLLVDRGDCYMTFKAWNAQNAGAVAILVVDDWPEPLNNLPEVEEGVDDCYMQNMTIPSAFISQSLGNSMKKALDNHEFVRVNLEWTEAGTHTEEQVDHGLKKDISYDECGSWCYDQIEEVGQWEVHPHTDLLPRFMIKPTSMWVVQVMKIIQRWSISFFMENGIISHTYMV